MNATHQNYSTKTSAVLYMAMELGEKEWKLGFTVGQVQPARLRTIPARDRRGLPEEIGRAKAHFDLPEDAPVRSCYEAGRDGFWVHRFLESIGVDNRVIDSSSIEVPRRSRRAKTDRLDAASLLKLLIRDHQGEPRVWSVVRVPSEDQEDARQLHRELEELKHEQTAHSNRIKGLLATCGVTVTIDKRFPTRVKNLRLWNDQGISKAGNRRLRTMLIELAWGWVRFQPECPLTQWFRRRFAGGSKRQRRIGIVALARKLLVALWKYLETGVPPEGAVLGDWEDKVSKYTVSLG